jgi:hypothetical protein
MKEREARSKAKATLNGDFQGNAGGQFYGVFSDQINLVGKAGA